MIADASAMIGDNSPYCKLQTRSRNLPDFWATLAFAEHQRYTAM